MIASRSLQRGVKIVEQLCQSLLEYWETYEKLRECLRWEMAEELEPSKLY